MKIPFNIKFRPQIKSGEYKVVTGDEFTEKDTMRLAKENSSRLLNLARKELMGERLTSDPKETAQKKNTRDNNYGNQRSD